MPNSEPAGRDLWSLDEYIVVGDLYLRRGRSSGVRDHDVVELAQLTGRSPASISRRLGNFDGTVRPGMGLKPVIGEPLAMFHAMQADEAFRTRVVREARSRLEQLSSDSPMEPTGAGPRFVDPEALEVEEREVMLPATTRQMIRAEAQLVRSYRNWLDPDGVRLRGLIIPAGDRVLRADLYDTRLDLLIEAKADSSRENVRYAIGQLFDYRRFLQPRPELALLVPDPLSGDLAALPAEAGVEVIWSTGDGFTDSVGGRLAGRT